MSTTTTDIFLDEGDQFIAGTSNINGGDKHTVRLGGVTVYGSLAELTELRDSLSDAIHAHRAPILAAS